MIISEKILINLEFLNEISFKKYYQYTYCDQKWNILNQPIGISIPQVNF